LESCMRLENEKAKAPATARERQVRVASEA
jgi:hypothetical protein